MLNVLIKNTVLKIAVTKKKRAGDSLFLTFHMIVDRGVCMLSINQAELYLVFKI